jgi:hypothetical protein
MLCRGESIRYNDADMGINAQHMRKLLLMQCSRQRQGFRRRGGDDYQSLRARLSQQPHDPCL